MSDRDFWERINDATDRAIDMARAERVLASVRTSDHPTRGFRRRMMGHWVTADMWKENDR